jgi:hypothetical protein
VALVSNCHDWECTGGQGFFRLAASLRRSIAIICRHHQLHWVMLLLKLLQGLDQLRGVEVEVLGLLAQP